MPTTFSTPTPLPRFIRPGERATAGARRFKVTDRMRAARYVLAADESSARDFYLAEHPDIDLPARAVRITPLED